MVYRLRRLRTRILGTKTDRSVKSPANKGSGYLASIQRISVAGWYCSMTATMLKSDW